MKADIVDRACKKLQITKSEMARAAGVNPSRISDVKSGRLLGFSRADTLRLVKAFPEVFTIEELIFFKRCVSEPRRAAKGGGR